MTFDLLVRLKLHQLVHESLEILKRVYVDLDAERSELPFDLPNLSLQILTLNLRIHARRRAQGGVAMAHFFSALSETTPAFPPVLFHWGSFLGEWFDGCLCSCFFSYLVELVCESSFGGGLFFDIDCLDEGGVEFVWCEAIGFG